MGKIKKNNKDVFQSYILTVAKYKFSIYEKRILYRLVDIAQKDVPQPLKNSLYKVEPSECGVNVTMPVADILKDETDNNYAKAKKAFKDLSEKGI
ncbi:replication initiation protein, partial [Prevotella copri]|nr:replication initiation protein [Segatella copri]